MKIMIISVGVLFVLAVMGIVFFVAHRDTAPTDVFGKKKGKTKEAMLLVVNSLGLSISKPISEEDVGEISGVYREFTVHVPAESATIRLSIKPVTIFLSSYSPEQFEAKPKGEAFDFHSKRVNKFFLTRYVTSNLTKAPLHKQGSKLNTSLDVFLVKWGTVIKYAGIRDEIITVRLKYGNGSYIPADILKPILDDLVALAEVLDATLLTDI